MKFILAFIFSFFMTAPFVSAQADDYFPRFEPALFETLQTEGKPVIVHINASWCTLCAMQRKTLRPMAADEQYADVTFLSLDFDDDKAFMEKFSVTERSTILAFKGGEQVARLDRTRDPETIRTTIQQAFDPSLKQPE